MGVGWGDLRGIEEVDNISMGEDEGATVVSYNYSAL